MKRASLLVDEPVVLKTVQTLLRRRGFVIENFSACLRPTEPESCNLECCSTDTAPDLVVMEVVVPRDCMGTEAALKLLQRWPGVKVLLTSATPNDFWPAEAVSAFAILPRSSTYFLAKPFTAQQLDVAISALMSQ